MVEWSWLDSNGSSECCRMNGGNVNERRKKAETSAQNGHNQWAVCSSGHGHCLAKCEVEAHSLVRVWSKLERASFWEAPLERTSPGLSEPKPWTVKDETEARLLERVLCPLERRSF